MRRRGKRGPNDSESTGKIGQELPQGQLAPLRPSYAESSPDRVSTRQPEALQIEAVEADTKKVLAEPEGTFADVVKASPVTVQEQSPESPASEPAPELPFPESPGIAAQGNAFKEVPGELPKEISGELFKASEPGSEPAVGEPAGKLVHETQPDSPSTPPPAAQAASPRAPRGFVVLTIGLPGSGKTTWFKRRAVQPLSSDMLRTILFDDITEQRYQGLVFSTLRSLLRARLIAKMPWNYVDATNLSPHERRQWIKMAKSFGYDVHAVFFDVPFEICMERNRRRERVVTEDVMQKMAERLRPPSFKEGFSKITIVRVKGSGLSTAVAAASAEELGDQE